MNYIIEAAKLEDAKEILNYLNSIVDETDNLLMTKEQLDELSVKDEEIIIESYLYSKVSLCLVAKIDGKIIAMGSLLGNNIKSRNRHKVNLGVTVRKKYWNMGIGREIIDSLLNYAVNNEIIEIVELEVKSDNYGAISLYERFGFEEIGYYQDYFKYDNNYGDAILMNLYL